MPTMFKTGVSRDISRKVYLLTVLVALACWLDSSRALTTFKRPADSSFQSSAPKRPTSGRRVMDPAFANAGQQAGVEIWRIEDFKPVPYPKKDYGKFYQGDSYIILRTTINKDGSKSWDIHFWLGKDTTQDEAGAAAIYAVQLDDQLGGVPVQHREVQEHESQLFLSHFKGGVRYLPGGVISGFTHVDPDAYVKRLFQVKGSRNIRVKEVDPNIKSMNKGDCFILDVGKNIYVYVGAKSRRIERLKAIGAANQIRDQDHAGDSKVHIIDEYSTAKEIEEFFQNLGGGSPDDVPEESAGGDDAQFETSQEKSVALYRVTDSTGTIKLEPIIQKPLLQSALDPNDCFILDTTDAHIFVWIGKGGSTKEKTEAMKISEGFLTSKKYPAWTRVERIVEGAEPTGFTQYFQGWKGARETHRRLVREASSEESAGWEARLFHASIKGKNNKFEVEQIFDFDQEDLYTDDVMILDVGTKVYLWVGNGASVQEKSKADNLIKDYLKKQHREHVDAEKLYQGQESPKFKAQFPSWNPDMWEENSYEKAKEKVAESNKKF